MQGISITNENGRVGMIVPNTFSLNVLAQKCRTKLVETTSVCSLFDLSNVDVFGGPGVRSLVIVLD